MQAFTVNSPRKTTNVTVWAENPNDAAKIVWDMRLARKHQTLLVKQNNGHGNKFKIDVDPLCIAKAAPLPKVFQSAAHCYE